MARDEIKMQVCEAIPPGEVRLVSEGQIRGKIYNIGIDQEWLEPQPELKIGDWPWPEPKKEA